jgi:prevent-host-death family protein
MSMKTMTASAASKEFGLYIDTVQHEPVVITKQNRPVAITMSIQQVERLFKGQVEAGIARGLEDVAAGRYSEMTPTHLETMRATFKTPTS